MSDLDPTWPSDLAARRERRLRILAIVVLVALVLPAVAGAITFLT
jgi:hypothetical protein